MARSDLNNDVQKPSDEISFTGIRAEEDLQDYVQNILENLVPEEPKVYSVEDGSTKILIPLKNIRDTDVNPLSVQILKQEKRSGPGIIFSTSGKIFNFDDQCPPVPYCLSFESKSIPRTKILIYQIRNFIDKFYDESERIAQAIFSRGISRRTLITKSMIVLALQILLTVSVIVACARISYLGEFIKKELSVFYYVAAAEAISFILLVFFDGFRKRNPYNYIALTTYTLSSSYYIGSLGVTHDTKVLLICLGITVIIFFAVVLLSWINYCDLTESNLLIMTLLGFEGIFFLIAQIYYWRTGSAYFRYIFSFTFLGFVCLFFIHLFQLVLGKGKTKMKTDEHLLAAIMMYLLTDVIYICLPTLVETSLQ